MSKLSEAVQQPAEPSRRPVAATRQGAQARRILRRAP